MVPSSLATSRRGSACSAAVNSLLLTSSVRSFIHLCWSWSNTPPRAAVIYCTASQLHLPVLSGQPGCRHRHTHTCSQGSPQDACYTYACPVPTSLSCCACLARPTSRGSFRAALWARSQAGRPGHWGTHSRPSCQPLRPSSVCAP